jgi:hypothetical protein
MSATNSPGFWVTNRLANPVLGPLLRGPLGRRLGRRLAVLRYRGRRTGQVHELVVQYVRHNNQVWIMPGHAEQKRWWRNMLDPQPVDVWLAGSHLTGVARVVRDAPDGDPLSEALAAYSAVFPKVPKATVMVGVDLAPTAARPEDGSAAHEGTPNT